MRQDFKKYTITVYKGYLGDFEAEWWTEEDWNNYRKEIEELKRTGEYGKAYEVSLTIQHNPLFDQPSPINSSSCRYEIIDLSKNN